MSNYLIVSIPKNSLHREKMLDFSECFHSEVSNFIFKDLEFFVYSKYKGSSFGNFLKGISLNHETRTILFHEGFNLIDEYKNGLKNSEGCFISLTKDEDKVEVFSDKFGLMPKLYTQFKLGGGAVSDSFFLLIALRSFLDETISFDAESFIARSWFNAITYQLINSETACEQIKYLPGNGYLTFHKDSLKMNVNKADLSNLLSEDIPSYEENIKSAADQIGGVLAGLYTIPGSILSLSATGGLDSRILICALSYLKKQGLDGSVRIGCKENGSGDLQLAQAVTKTLKLPFNVKAAPSTDRKMVDKLVEWTSFCCGLYDPLYATGAYTESNSVISIGGHGGELYKGAYGWRAVDNIGKSVLENEIYIKFRDGLNRGVASVNLVGSHEIASEYHYLGYRNAIHSTRFLQNTMLGLRPLMNEKLVLSAYNHSELDRNRYQISHDLAILFDIEGASMPYDHPSKCITSEFALQRAERLGVMNDIEPYNVVGHPAVLRSGSLLGSIKLVDDFLSKKDVPREKEELKIFLHKFLDKCELVDSSTCDRLTEGMTASKKSAYINDTATGKIMSLYVINSFL